MAENQREATSSPFEILDEGVRARMIRADIGMSSRGVWVREKAAPRRRWWRWIPGSASSMRQEASGSGKWVHIHHSMPYFDSRCGGTTQRELSAKVKEGPGLVAVFKRSRDGPDDRVLNHASFQRMVERCWRRAEALYLYIIDLDDFKSVNGTDHEDRRHAF